MKEIIQKMIEFIEETDGIIEENSEKNESSVEEVQIQNVNNSDDFLEILLNENDKKILTDGDLEMNALLRELGAVQMDYFISTENLKSRIAETKARIDAMVNQTIKLNGGNMRYTDVSLDANTGILKVKKA
jgi:hypothetical protein